MALMLQTCRILHTPKTGGEWVSAAIANAGIIYAHAAGHHEHLNLRNCPGKGLSTIAFIRDPWSWWKSYWVFKRTYGWDRSNPFDMACISDSFEHFLRKALDRCPGFWTRVCELYVGRPGEEIEFIGRFERLVDDLVTALTIAGENFDEGRIRETPPQNVGKYQLFSTNCSQELQQRVLDAEQAGRQRFGY